jgi:hypothetical protein
VSVSSILAFVLLGTGAFKGPRDKAEERPSRTRYSKLVMENGELRRRVEELEGDVARANVQYRRDQELIDTWRERALAPPGGIGAQRPAGPDFRPPHVAQQQAQMLQAQAALQQSQLAQYAPQSQQAMNAQNLYAQSQQANLGGAMGLLGAQSLINAELWCNCVPSRSQVWAATDPE